MITIEIVQQGQPPIKRELDVGSYKLGRSLWNDLRIKSNQIKKHHLTLEVDEENCVVKPVSSVKINGVECRDAIAIANDLPVELGDISLYITHHSEVSNKISGSPKSSRIEDNNPSTVTNDRQDTIQSDRHVVTDTASLQQVAEWTGLKRKLQQATLERLDLYKRDIIDGINDEQLRLATKKEANKIIADGIISLPDAIDREKLINETVAESIGLGPLEPLLDDESITEIMVNGSQQVYVERYGKIEEASTHFTSNASLLSVIERIVSPLGRRIDEGSPMVDARLADGSRVNAIIPPLSLVGPVITIRKFSRERFTLQHLVALNSLSLDMAELLEICVRHRKNIVVCGGTGSGKTTFLNALSDCIPETERIVTIEDAAELQLSQRHVISLESRPPNVEHTGEVTIRDLVRNALRMRPDRIVVGECRGGEALDMLQAMNTGHEGSLTTAHANSPRDLLSRLEVMVLMAGMDMPVKVIREQVASAVDIIVHQCRFSDGKRRITAIVEVDGMEGDVVLMQKLFEFRQTGMDSHGNVEGHYRSLGLAPRFYTELQEAGIEMDHALFRGYEEPHVI